ncbi:deleted in malignant brain tumors 1 protein-like isoform X2 [Montipora foliosa]|uniref:deleted in malignant brain tumors 1 protein-like isoform X2 n=1 Tax=Montipora foliosa TaxID=591990 RepID=UPI0035F10FCF
MASSMISWFVFVIFTSQTTASHFRGGIITWKPDEYIGNKVNFNFRLGFRRSFSNSYFCDSAMVAQQSIVGSGGIWSASHDRGYYASRTVAGTGYHCTDFSVSEDWTQGENTFNYTFPDDGPWLVSYSSCCWISLVNGGGNWFLSTTVNLTRRQDNGKINSSPISALSPIVRHQQGCLKRIVIPAEDSDGDKVRCRWSKGSQRECGGVCQRFSSSGTLDEEKCTLRIHSNAALGWHAVAITLEDFPASTTNFQTATPFSHVSLQFLVHVSSSSGPCNRAPLLIGRSLNDGSCEEVPDGGIFYSIIEAKHIDSSRRIAEIITVTPLYMNLTNLLNYTDNVGDTVYYKNVSWSPKSSQKGRHIFCFKAIDDYGMESDQRCITLLVGSNNTPRPILSTRTPLIPTLYWPWGSGFVDFNITFDQQIKRPRHSKFIRIILEGHVIYKLDTRSSSDVTIDQNGFTLRFSLPQAVMSMRGNYSVTMDRGAVVGRGCTSDGPPTPGFSSTKSWTFRVGVCSKRTFIADGYYCNDVDECSNPSSILSRKKRYSWYWPYRYSSSLPPAIYSSPLSTGITPAPSSAQGSSASAISTVAVSGSCPYFMNGQLNGRFTSPNYPSNYGSNERCSLLIEAPRGHYIYLQFRSFHLEHASSCNYDYLEVFDGNSAWSPKITRACGQRYQGPKIHSSGRFLYVKFRSDGSVQYSGFSVDYYAVSKSQQVMSSIVKSSCNFATSSPLISSTRASSAAIMSMAPVSGWTKYSQVTSWCTSAGRSYVSSYMSIIQCQRYCETRPGCNAIEFWEGRSRYCYECTDTSKITPYTNSYGWGYPVYVWVKNGFTPLLPLSLSVQSTAAIYSPLNLLTSSPTASSAATMSMASLSGWTKYSQVTSWCTSAGRSYVSISMSIIQCQRYCETRPGCNAIEFWEGSSRYCYECTDTSKITPYTNSYDWGYPVYVWVKNGFTPLLPLSLSVQSTAAIYSPLNLLTSSPTASSAATMSMASLSGWTKYSQVTSWCTSAGRSYVSISMSIIQCQRYCEARPGCNAIEFWEGGSRDCYECTDTSKITPYTYSYTWGYPVYVWVKNGFTPLLPLSLSVQSTAAIYSPLNLLTSSPTGSVDIQASTAMVIPTVSRVPFVLRLPANCQHNCVNTWGSYYCTCRQGYKLQADGTTCEDINECKTQNGGCTHQCINIPGSHYCKCRDGTTMSIDNKTCHEPGINVKCTDKAMSIILERKSFQGFDPSKLSLLYPSCRASYNDTHITLRTSLNDCGTTHNESDDAITFYNKVRSLQFSPGKIITRNQNVSIPFYCSFGRKAIVRNPSFKTWKNYVASSEGGYGNFTFTMDMFKTSNYNTPYRYDDYPVTVSLQDRLYLQIAVKSHQSNLVVFVDTCKATTSSDPYSVPQYIFIQRGCGLDSTLTYSYSINSKQRLSIQAFRFIQNHPVVHFHCEVLACHRNTARSRCLQGCSRSRGRRDEDPGSLSTQVYEMSSGPIKFQKTNPGKWSKNAAVQTNMGLVKGVAAAGGVLLLLAIALAVAVVHVKKRFKGILADRNRVYAMEQLSKYVIEEKANDGFPEDDDVNGSGEQGLDLQAST